MVIGIEKSKKMTKTRAEIQKDYREKKEAKYKNYQRREVKRVCWLFPYTNEKLIKGQKQ